MILWLHSDAAYNNTSKGRSRAGGHFWLGNHPTKDMQYNGAVLALAKVIKHVMGSATEAELASMYMNAREAVPLRNILEELGHKQPATPIVTDNAVAEGIVNKTVKQQRTKAMDMRFYWLQDRAAQKQFQVVWDKGMHNLGDYHTKRHSPAYHQAVRHKYVHMDTSP